MEQAQHLPPEEIAKLIFSDFPKNPCSHKILSDITDSTFLYEILITILMEGLDEFTHSFTNINLKKFNKTHINYLNPWMKSLGFKTNVKVLNIGDKELYKKYYCKIRVKTKLNEMFFKIKKVTKNYHFVLNGDYLEENKNKKNLKDVYGVFIVNDKVYCISFDFSYA